MNLLSGRMSRRVFWACYAAYTLLHLVLLFATGSAAIADLATFAPWLWMATKRLHDLNANWWWAMLPFGVGFVRGVLGGVANAADIESARNALQQVAWNSALQHPLEFMYGFAMGYGGAVMRKATEQPISFAIITALMLVLLLWPGTRGPNRFGEPPQSRRMQSA